MSEQKDNNPTEQEAVAQATQEVVSDAAQVVDAEPLSVEQLQAELDKVKAEAASHYDQFLRAQAELANQRRRAEKQVEDAHKYAVQKFVESLIPVIDSLEMGLQAQGDVEQIREGMRLTLKQFESVMEKFNIQSIGQPGEVFNPEHHQAMSMQPHPDYNNNTVSMVMQKGYLLHGRVVRPAMVMVCKK